MRLRSHYKLKQQCFDATRVTVIGSPPLVKHLARPASADGRTAPIDSDDTILALPAPNDVHKTFRSGRAKL